MSALLTVVVELICVLPLSVFSDNNCTTLKVYVDDVLEENVNCIMYVSGNEDVTFNIVNKETSLGALCAACYGIILEWTGPKKDLNRQAIKGYIVHFTEVETGGILCRVLDLRKFNFKSPNIKFIFEIFPLNRRARNTRLVDIFTVPLPPLEDFEERRKYHHQIASLPPTKSVDEIPSNWTTMISLKRIHGQGIVEGTFLFAKDAFGFVNYTVQLARKGSTTPTAESCVQQVAGETQGKFMFSNLTAGEYYLQKFSRLKSNATLGTPLQTGVEVEVEFLKVKPFDSYFNIRDKCLCWEDKGELIGKDCDTCSTSVTTDFSLYDADYRKESPFIQTSNFESPFITSTMESRNNGHKKQRPCFCIKVVCFIMATAVWFL